jgi:hypothetical protein
MEGGGLRVLLFERFFCSDKILLFLQIVPHRKLDWHSRNSGSAPVPTQVVPSDPMGSLAVCLTLQAWTSQQHELLARFELGFLPRMKNVLTARQFWSVYFIHDYLVFRPVCTLYCTYIYSYLRCSQVVTYAKGNIHVCYLESPPSWRELQKDWPPCLGTKPVLCLKKERPFWHYLVNKIEA